LKKNQLHSVFAYTKLLSKIYFLKATWYYFLICTGIMLTADNTRFHLPRGTDTGHEWVRLLPVTTRYTYFMGFASLSIASCTCL